MDTLEHPLLRDAPPASTPDGAAERPAKAEQVPPPPRRRMLLYVGIPVLALLGWGGWSHWRVHQAATDTQRSQQDFTPEVRTAQAQRTDKPVELTEPGQTVAFDNREPVRPRHRLRRRTPRRYRQPGSQGRPPAPHRRTRSRRPTRPGAGPGRPTPSWHRPSASQPAAGRRDTQPQQRHQVPHHHPGGPRLGDAAERRSIDRQRDRRRGWCYDRRGRHRRRCCQPQGPASHGPAAAGSDRVRAGHRAVRWRHHRPQRRCRRSSHRRQRQRRAHAEPATR